MNAKQDAQHFFSQVQQRWNEANQHFVTEKNKYLEVLRLLQLLKAQKNVIENQIVEKVRKVKNKLLDKSISLTEMNNKMALQLAAIQIDEKYLPSSKKLFKQQKIDQLSIILQNPLKFDSLKVKMEKKIEQMMDKCGSLKEEIKVIKLKLSLSEMEYKQISMPGKRKSD